MPQPQHALTIVALWGLGLDYSQLSLQGPLALAVEFLTVALPTGNNDAAPLIQNLVTQWTVQDLVAAQLVKCRHWVLGFLGGSSTQHAAPCLLDQSITKWLDLRHPLLTLLRSPLQA